MLTKLLDWNFDSHANIQRREEARPVTYKSSMALLPSAICRCRALPWLLLLLDQVSPARFLKRRRAVTLVPELLAPLSNRHPNEWQPQTEGPLCSLTWHAS